MKPSSATAVVVEGVGHVFLDRFKSMSYYKSDVCVAWLCLDEVSFVAGAKKGDDKKKNGAGKAPADAKKTGNKNKEKDKRDQGGKKGDDKGGNKAAANKDKVQADRVRPSADGVRTFFTPILGISALNMTKMRDSRTAGVYR